MPRILTILGSGETSPTMVTPHQRTFTRLGSDVRAVLLDSPYGFQENADELTEKAQQFFRESVGREVDVVTFRKAPAPDLTAHAVEMARLRAADWIFAGPGSPSYALRTWAGSAVPEALHARLRDGGAVTFASAAALTLGALTIPVYEVYKVGDDPYWLEGLDVVGGNNHGHARDDAHQGDILDALVAAAVLANAQPRMGQAEFYIGIYIRN
mgnify:CR=1 FL=1